MTDELSKYGEGSNDEDDKSVETGLEGALSKPISPLEVVFSERLDKVRPLSSRAM